MNESSLRALPVPGFLTGGGELAQLIARFDWSTTPLGALDSWPHSVRTTVGLILMSPVPIVTLWGEQGVMIYNDAYSGFAGGRHPALLGSNVREGWDEVAEFNDHVMYVGLAGGTLAYRDQELTLYRRGAPEQVWMNLDYSPILDEAGEPCGVIAIVVETTAKVRAERWLSGERERLRRMFEQAPGLMAMLSGPDHIFELANPAFMQLIGRRDVIGRTVRDSLPELRSQGFLGMLDDVFVNAKTVSGNAASVMLGRSSKAATQERFVDYVCQPLRDDLSQVIGIFVQGTDVTDRVMAERTARTSAANFATLAQVVPVHVWVATPEGSLDWFNDRVYQYSGYGAGTLAGSGWESTVHPDDRKSALESWRYAVEQGIPYETQFRICRADGIYRWHLVRAQAIRNDSGDVVRWIGTNTDIEDQKSATQALSKVNATLTHEVEARTAERDRVWRLSGDLMLIAGFEGIIAAVNPAWTSLLEWEESELLGHQFLDLVHPDDLAATRREMATLSQGANTFRFENRHRCKHGGYRILSWTAVPDENFIHAVGRDVTADRAAADVLARTEKALQQSQKMETIGKLTGGVAHDFNNLLQVISGNLQLLARDVIGNDRAERRVAQALAGVGRGAKLASHLLAFGRRQALEPKVVKIGRFVVGMEDMLRRSLGEEIEIEISVSGGLWNTFVDPVHVENALLNLSINARDAMQGRGKLTIEVGNAFLDDAYAQLHAEVAAGQYVILAVTDTGSGMSAEVQAQAFEPFFSTKPEGKGTGLGLSMVYGFVKQSGGHVKIYSEAGHGTTVKLYLPRTLEGEDAIAPVDTRPTIGGQETILVAEDDDQVRTTVVEMLSELGYRVLKATDAASALTIIDSGVAIDLLFTDVVMPGALRSPDLARKARERLPNLAVLFTSGYTENAIVHGGRLDAGVELLGKPYTSEALARKVRHVLASQQQRDQGSARTAPPGIHASVIERMRRLKVLVVEDDELVRQNTAELLQDLGHTVVQAGDVAQAQALLSRSALDVLITDVDLAGQSGLDIATIARELQPGIGIVLATGHDDTATASDHALLRKPYDSVGIVSALRAVTST